MATPITFKPAPIDPHTELMKRVHAAPHEHAEALLVAWDLLQTAHDQGVLDLAQGLLGGRDKIAGKLAEAGKSEEGIAIMRNALSAGKILGSFDPDLLQKIAKSLDTEPIRAEKKAPGFFTLIRRAFAADTRRGFGLLLNVVARTGKFSQV